MACNVRDLVCDVLESGQASLRVEDGRAGVWFDEAERFIAFDVLGYRADTGFYSLEEMPGLVSEATNENPWRVAPWQSYDWKAFVLCDDQGFGYLMGEWWQMVDAYNALKAVIEAGCVEGRAVRLLGGNVPRSVGREKTVYADKRAVYEDPVERAGVRA